MKDLIKQIFSISSDSQFEESCLSVFRHQAENCNIYKEYISHLRVKPAEIKTSMEIPYLPISFFKTHEILSSKEATEITFSSSGTTGMVQSRHLVTDLSVYDQSFTLAFEQFYGQIENTCFLALLPSYLERDGSSLIYMVDALIRDSKHPDSGYFLHNHEELHQKLNQLKATGQKTILIGVTYALLDFIEQYQLDFPELVVMETGGMKGKRKEMVREELHGLLQTGFGVSDIHSEYGMTELLSQAYSKGEGIFACPPWMKIHLRDTNDPLTLLRNNRSGGINVIDLANLNSCSFIATQDLGRLFRDGSFEVLGRFDNADIRGCNLLVQ
ncbi:Acyl-protein synthetase, LuxE [Pedobacter steynii]|uniref:Acyl-protein synthetase, LuxE n=1 Tax=Pedobacter steynii TaxID=430522 RepID=A0A1G9YIE7_9SPHI|nr:acyl transferase [Pedobacter steynii]NQX39735.1 acyl transferase [Pedobacter steynii]SDN08949.1 Acyl-protein synthetase, LuxE [Pedobacter steynii]